jgi:hypothetical protein
MKPSSGASGASGAAHLTRSFIAILLVEIAAITGLYWLGAYFG